MRAINTYSAHPIYAATRYKPSDGSAGQRQEILFFPQPDQAFVLSYEYEAYNGALSDANPYPLGGMQMAELYFDAPGGGQRYMETVVSDGMERFMDLEGLAILESNTEMVGIP